MSYVLRDSCSLEDQIDYATGVIAGLQARSETSPLAAAWLAIRRDLRTERDARDDDRAALLGASAVLKVLDVVWDAALTRVSGQAFLDSDKNEKKSPYCVLFSVPAAVATRLGVHKATAYGDQLLARAAEVNDDKLASALADFASVNAALAVAGVDRDAAAEKVLLHDVSRRKLLTRLEQLIATTEVGILTQFPGQRELVQAILAPPHSEKAAAASPAPADHAAPDVRAPGPEA